MSDKDGQWTADDIRRNAPNWSLQCDGKLLEYMQNLSKTIEERGNRTTYNMHSSMLELDRTKIALENATNQLMALQHKQFVENRVYDDDETLANVENVPISEPSTTNETKSSMIDALRTSIETGVALMDKYFDKVTLELSDSEDDGEEEEEEKSVIFRPKDMYQNRPLPHLIGSKQWHEKWHIGLEEDESDESGNENADEASLSSSSSANSVSSNVPVSLSESENPTGVILSRKSDPQPLFESSSEENVSRSSRATADNNSTFRKSSTETPHTDQSAKQFDPREINASNSIFRQQKVPTVSHVIPSLIDSNPPELDDVPSIKTPHKPANLFLDDENDPDDFNIFEDKSAKRASAKDANEHKAAAANRTPAKSINLFADDDDDGDNFDGFLPSTSKAVAKKPESNVGNLFADDEEDELFLQPPEPSTSRTPRTSILTNAPKKDVFICNLFDDEPPEDDFLATISTKTAPSTSKTEKSTTESQQKKPSDLFSTKVNLFDDEDDDDDDDTFKRLIIPAASKTETPKKDSRIKIDFENESDDWDDTINSKNDKKSAVSSPEKSKSSNPIRLFDDMPPSDDEQLFSSISSKKTSFSPTSTKLLGQSPEKKAESKQEVDFEADSSKNDGQTIVQPASKPKLTDPIRLFDDSPPSDDEQLFSSVSSRKPVTTSKQSTGEFYNDFSDTITAIPTKSQDTKKHANLFDDENMEPVKETQPTIEDKPDAIAKVETTKSEKRSEFLKKIDAFSNVSTNEPEKEAVPVSKVAQPKKLNIGNIDINVAALLPGAKRSKSIEKTDSSIERQASERESDDQLSPISDNKTIIKNVSQDNVDSSGRLVNLNRNRAKNLSRRPSTRTGRKQQYQKSIENDEKTDEISDSADKTDSIAKNNDHVNSTPSTVNLPVTDTIDRADEKVTTKQDIPSIPTKNQLNSTKNVLKSLKDESEPLTNEPSSPQNQQEPLKTQSNDKMQTKIGFEDELLETNSPAKLSRDSEEIVVKLPSFLDEPNEQDDVNDEDPFSFLNEPNNENDNFLSPSESEKMENASASEINNISTKATPAAVPAYIDELPPDLDADDNTFDAKNNKSSLLSENALSLFGDDDDDDDFGADGIFSSRSAQNQTAPSKLEEEIPKLEDIWSPYPSNFIPDKPPSSSDKKSTKSVVDIFVDDDDLDADDIFNSKNSKTPSKSINEPKEQQLPAQVTSSTSKSKKASLFGDDNDDDDLFGDASESIKKPMPEPAKQSHPKKIVTKIFSDDSSDDDLFGGNKTKKNPVKRDPSSAVKNLKSAKESKASDKLFSDSESDGDDLFGSKSKPNKTASRKLPTHSTSKVSKEDSQPAKTTLSPSAVNNDPLADLLK